MAKRSAKDYASMSADVEAGEYTVSGPVEMGRTLRMGRPVGGGPKRGPSKSRSVRLSAEMDGCLVALAAREDVEPSEVLRRALVEYVERHRGQRS
jgi:hypothetical protein